MKYNDFHYHLMNRGWRNWLNSWVDFDSEVVVFPLLTVDRSKLIGYQRYRWNEPKIRGNQEHGNQRYFTYVSEAYKGMAIYGWDNCFGHGPLIVTEGIFDALKVTNCWWDCVALLTNQPTKQFKDWFRMVTRGRCVCAVLDQGEPTDRWLQLADYVWYPPSQYKDLGDMPLDEVRPFIEGQLQNVKLQS